MLGSHIKCLNWIKDKRSSNDSRILFRILIQSGGLMSFSWEQKPLMYYSHYAREQMANVSYLWHDFSLLKRLNQILTDSKQTSNCIHFVNYQLFIPLIDSAFNDNFSPSIYIYKLILYMFKEQCDFLCKEYNYQKIYLFYIFQVEFKYMKYIFWHLVLIMARPLQKNRLSLAMSRNYPNQHPKLLLKTKSITPFLSPPRLLSYPKQSSEFRVVVKFDFLHICWTANTCLGHDVIPIPTHTHTHTHTSTFTPNCIPTESHNSTPTPIFTPNPNSDPFHTPPCHDTSHNITSSDTLPLIILLVLLIGTRAFKYYSKK